MHQPTTAAHSGKHCPVWGKHPGGCEARQLGRSGGGGSHSPLASAPAGASWLLCRLMIIIVAASAARRASAGQATAAAPSKGTHMAAAVVCRADRRLDGHSGCGGAEHEARRR